MNFLFVDRILQIEPGKKIVGIKHVSEHDLYLSSKYTGEPILFPSLVSEALGQLANWLVSQHHDFKLRLVAGIVKQVNTFDYAHVGDTILLESEIVSWDDEAVIYNSQAKVGEKVICSINNAIGPFVQTDEFEGSETAKKQFNIINRPGDISNYQQLGQVNKQNSQANCHDMQFDRILDWQPGKSVVAQKNISLIAPYFEDHFPRNPVFPMSLLLHCKMQLAQQFLIEMLGENALQQFELVQARNIKMNDFIRPGDSAICTMSCKKTDEDNYVMKFRTEVAGKRVCVSEVEFIKNAQQDHSTGFQHSISETA